jgi:Fic family protein
MVTKLYDLTDAVTDHTGAFPPVTFNYQTLLGPLEEATSSLARYDTRMSTMINSELFIAPLRRQDAVMRPLLRTAVAHVEFEALHPFDDGNGRIGRMLITLMLWKLGVLTRPNFFVSGYFEAHKEEYIEKMRAVSSSGDWTGWVVFFLEAMHEQASVNIRTADGIFRLHGEMRERFRLVLNSQFHDQALDFVFGSPIFRNDRFVERSGIPASSARSLSRRLVEAGLLRTIDPASGRRAAMYAFDPLLDMLKV